MYYMNFIDLTGQRFGRLVVLERSKEPTKYGSKWLCQCDCGNTIVVLSNNLRTGRQASCGCLRKDLASIRKMTHGLSTSGVYITWKHMLDRCTNPNNIEYHNYGGRGITICEDWYDLLNFYNWAILNGWEEGLTIDRIDVNGNYEPSNCRWLSKLEQAQNKRNTTYITFNGKTQSASQWAKEFNLTQKDIHNRLKLGWSFEKILTTPVKRRQKREKTS